MNLLFNPAHESDLNTLVLSTIKIKNSLMKRLSILTAALAALFFVSCNSGTTGMPVPKDAAIVVHIDGASLGKKIDWKTDVKASEWFKDAYKKATDRHDSLQVKIMDDPENSGVNIKSDFVFFMQPRGKGNYLVFEGNIKDMDKFEAVLKDGNKSKEFKTDGDLKYSGEYSSITAWTKSKFFIISNLGGTNYSYDDHEKGSVITDSLVQYAKSLLSLKKSDGIESDDRFGSLIKENGDVHFWMNMEKYYSLIGSTMQNSPVGAMMTSMNKFYKGSISTGTMSFDDGKITVKTKQYNGEEMKKLLDKYKFEPITKDLVNRIPSQNVVAALLVNYPPEASREMLKAMGMDGWVNMFLGKANLTLDEIVQATKGQIVFAATDFTWPAQVSSPAPNEYPEMGKPDIKLLLGLSVNNKAAFDKLVSALEGQIEDSAERRMIMSKINYQVTNDWFAVSNSPDAVQKFLAGGNNNLPFADKITGHPFGVYIDLQKALKTLPAQLMGQTAMRDAAVNTWQDIVMTGGDYKDGISTGEISINMVDKNMNSLKQMNQFIEKMYVAQKKQEAEMENRYRNYQDSAAPPAEIVPEAPKQ
jgi:hypothetical protein